MKIVIAGSSGFIGTHLASFFGKRGDTLILLSRQPDKPNAYFWDPHEKQIDPSILEGAEIVINLAGESILGRWNQKKMDRIRESRLASTQFLCHTLLGLTNPPKTYLGASAIGYYGDRQGEILTESSASGHGYLAEVCREWEKIPEILNQKGIRTVFTRFGLVLGGDGGALRYMEKAFRTGMGGVLGSGEQRMSWIAIDDVCRAFQHIIEHPEISGPVNLTAPFSLTNKEFTKIIGKILNRPTLISVPEFALSMLFGSGSEIFLSSLDVQPKRLLESGFEFKYPRIEEVLKKYLLINV